MTTITPQVLEAFSKCKTKAYLLAKASQIEHSAKAITEPENATPLTNELRTLLSAAEPPKFLPCDRRGHQEMGDPNRHDAPQVPRLRRDLFLELGTSSARAVRTRIAVLCGLQPHT